MVSLTEVIEVWMTVPIIRDDNDADDSEYQFSWKNASNCAASPNKEKSKQRRKGQFENIEGYQKKKGCDDGLWRTSLVKLSRKSCMSHHHVNKHTMLSCIHMYVRVSSLVMYFLIP